MANIILVLGKTSRDLIREEDDYHPRFAPIN